MTYKRQQPTALPSITSFYTPDGSLRSELLDSVARKLGEAFEKSPRRGGQYYVSSTQLRRFYNDVKQLQDKIQKHLIDKGIPEDSQDPGALQPYLALVKMLKAKVAYARRPGMTERVSPEFKKTIDECIELVQSPRDFQAFVLFFEAIVGYYYGAGGGK